ncbi:MAG: pyridoxamine 5'-phosphate oxidase family protein [Candidatus Omnitrophica bacterium]|nr:pyridoxamine 5'-phosphate oxidase family protein [Candidatus Omnitrophota bacterium]
MSEDLKTLAQNMLKTRSVFYMATIDDGVPRVRPMTCLYADQFKVYTCSHRSTGKIQQIMKNNNVELCFMDDQNRLLRITGVAELYEDEKAWSVLPLNPQAVPMCEDPDYLLIAVIPKEVRLTNDWSLNYKTIPLQ